MKNKKKLQNLLTSGVDS